MADNAKSGSVFSQVADSLGAAGTGASFERAVVEAQEMGLTLERQATDTKGQFVYTLTDENGESYDTNVLSQGKRSVRGFLRELASRAKAK